MTDDRLFDHPDNPEPKKTRKRADAAARQERIDEACSAMLDDHRHPCTGAKTTGDRCSDCIHGLDWTAGESTLLLCRRSRTAKGGVSGVETVADWWPGCQMFIPKGAATNVPFEADRNAHQRR